jgi:hypothetical protein
VVLGPSPEQSHGRATAGAGIGTVTSDTDFPRP